MLSSDPKTRPQWLRPVSWLYRGVVTLRNKCFDWGILKSKSFDLPVICVGNLTAGGTGKTPHTEYLVRLLGDNYHVAVLSRGYKRKTKGYVSANAHSTAATIGDEPYQMYGKFPKATFAVDENRCHGIEQLLKLKDPAIDVILLDDAFQHRYVKAGLNILLTDYNRLFCDDELLPVGRLREPVRGKDRAHAVIVTKCPDDIKPIDFNIITKQLNLYPYQQLFFSALRYGNLQALFPDGETKPTPRALASLSHTDVLLVTGIASPEPLHKELQKTASKVDLLSFGDHHAFHAKDLQLIKERFEKLKDRRVIITTEKDATRLANHPELDESLKPHLYVLPVEIEFLQGQQENFNQYIIDYVRENTRNGSLSEKQDAHQP